MKYFTKQNICIGDPGRSLFTESKNTQEQTPMLAYWTTTQEKDQPVNKSQ